MDANDRDAEDVPLLHWAAINDRREIVKYLLKQVNGDYFNIISRELKLSSGSTRGSCYRVQAGKRDITTMLCSRFQQERKALAWFDLVLLKRCCTMYIRVVTTVRVDTMRRKWGHIRERITMNLQQSIACATTRYLTMLT